MTYLSRNISSLFLLSGILLIVQSCTPTGAILGAGTAAGIAIVEERQAKTILQDNLIQAQIIEKWFAYDHSLSASLDVEVYDGRVLITGALKDVRKRDEAIRLAWMVENVKEVLNEIQDVEDSFVDTAKDSLISTKLRTNLTLDQDISAINYAIETTNQTIYLIGLAQNQAELDRVIRHARDISGVRGVVVHVKVKANATPESGSNGSS